MWGGGCYTGQRDGFPGTPFLATKIWVGKGAGKQLLPFLSFLGSVT